MTWRSIQNKQVGDAVAHLVTGPNRYAGILIEQPYPSGVWKGIAAFPPAVPQDDALQHAIALQRFEELQDSTDIEDLIREWGDPDGEELVEFIEAGSAERGEELGGADDLPDLIVPESLIRPRKKLSKLASKAKTRTVKSAPPYSPRNYPKPVDAKPNTIKLLPLDHYDHIIVSFSGGKDSVACALLLLEMGIEPSRIELWHQAVDGEPGVAERFWDWPVTESYCEAFAKAFGMRMLFQWKDGGYLGELTRRDVPTAPTTFQLPNGRTMTTGGEGEPGTRLAYPAMSADLKTRWCSAYMKIDVAKKVFTNDPRFANSKTLILTGERRQESSNRASYPDVADYSSTKKRIVHQWRAVLGWFEQDVWEIMEKFRVRPHPAYYLGWSRVSCLPCIFGNPDQWASVGDLAPELLERMAKLEDKFYVASREISDHPWSVHHQEERHQASEAKKRANNPRGYTPKPFKPKGFDGYLRTGESLTETAARGTSYIQPNMRKYIELGMGEHYPLDVLLEDGETWETPNGAYKHSGGPT